MDIGMTVERQRTDNPPRPELFPPPIPMRSRAKTYLVIAILFALCIRVVVGLLAC